MPFVLVLYLYLLVKTEWTMLTPSNSQTTCELDFFLKNKCIVSENVFIYARTAIQMTV